MDLDDLQSELTRAYEQNRETLWGLGYRMLGTSADADEVVQEAFLRALERPPARPGPLLPWLVRVTTNLARDRLRRRKLRGYTGSWLPEPMSDARLDPVLSAPAPVESGPGARYAQRESLSLAFLLALEELSPTQRAVLVLRDVFGYSVRECAETLDLSQANVKTTLHRARKAMASYEARRRPPTPSLAAEIARALEQFLTCLATGDVQGVLAALAEDVVLLSDGGGEVTAALLPILGRAKVARFFLRQSAKRDPEGSFTTGSFNGLPGLVFRQPNAPPGFARRFLLLSELDHAGLLSRVLLVLAPGKLSAVEAA
ncbi:MAG: sigma-70 family RNA polymerase sigma factor [Planctomycetota bacterium]|nr:MAG: sigma-70 family RNA polymerase sigma factor [Planctomycetota bacterium]